MISGFMGYFGGRKDSKQAAREAIIGLRQQLQMLEKKEEYTLKRIEEETKKAKANVVANKNLATTALRMKKALEADLERLNGTRMQLETQMNTLESANLNAETMQVMAKASAALKVIHGNLTPQKVDATMDAINEQREIANEISEAISHPMGDTSGVDEDELKQELADLEREELDERLMGAQSVPAHIPSLPVAASKQPILADDEEERQLKELQAQLAM